MGAGRAEMQLTMRMITEMATTKVPTRLRYSCADPYAVAVVFHSEGAYPIEWIFARDLLAAGLATAAGDGDVRVWPAESGDLVFLELRSPSGQAVFAAQIEPLEDFLVWTERLVPFGAETAVLDLDRAVGLLLHGDPGVTPG